MFVCARVSVVWSGKENTSGWECAEEDGKTKALLSCPLLTCKLSVFSSRTHTLKVRGELLLMTNTVVEKYVSLRVGV